MNEWTAQQRPAPQFEQEQIVVAPATARAEAPDLDAMAVELDHMKVDAAVDAERTRASLNGLLAFVVVTGATYLAEYVAQYGAHTLAVLTAHPAAGQGPGPFDPQKGAIAIGVGLGTAGVVATLSHLAQRRTQRTVHAYEQRLIDLGGTPLPERGQPLRPQRQQGR